MEEEINEMLHELLKLEELVKQYSKRIDEIRSWCKKQGPFTTNEFICAVIPRSRTSLVSLELASKLVGMEYLATHDLIQTITYSTIHVSERDAL